MMQVISFGVPVQRVEPEVCQEPSSKYTKAIAHGGFIEYNW